MDPTTTLRMILDAIADNDRDTAIEGIENLLQWLKMQGHLPHVVSIKDDYLHSNSHTFQLPPHKSN